MTFCHTISIIVLTGAKAQIWQRWEDRSRRIQKKRILSIRTDDSLFEKICDYARKHNMTVTEVVLAGLEKILSESKSE